MTARLTDIIEQSMLLEESKSKQDEVLLVEAPSEGLGYQMIAALTRLGMKSKVRSSVPDERLRPLQVLTSSDDTYTGSSGYLSAPLAALQRQNPLSDNEMIALEDEVSKFSSDSHVVVILPYTTTPDHVRRLHTAHRTISVVLSPKLVGFRDGDFFESLVTNLRNQNGTKWEQLKERATFEGLLISDLCGFLISVLWSQKFFQKTLICPHVTITPKAIVEVFERELEFKATMLEKLKSKFTGGAPSAQNANQAPDLKNLLISMPSSLMLLDELPTTVSSVTLWAKKVAEYLERNPETDLHFPPARAP